MNDIRVTQELAEADIIPQKVGIPCLICGKVLETEMGSHRFYPYICDECKEAVAYAKQLKTKPKHDPLKAILD